MPPKSPRTKIVIASLIGLTSVLGAVAAWRSSVAGSAAADAERTGFADVVRREQIRSGILSQGDAIVFDFVRLQAYRTLAEGLRAQAAAAGPDDAPRLAAEATAYERLTELTQDYVDPDAIAPDGTLDLDTKFRIEWELAKNQQDVDPAPEFAEADALSLKSQRLVGLTALLIAAAFFFTLAQISRTRAWVLYLGGGSGVVLIATALLVVLEVT